jgi:RNA polymerase sigma-70 factor, ECF subfamily
METNDQTLKNALNGDIRAFQMLFAQFQPQLKSYIYRLLADRNDTDDITHDTFVRAFDKLGTYGGKSSLKTWVFQIATNLAYDYLRTRPRWRADAQDESRAYSLANPYTREAFFAVHTHSPQGAYDLREHIDFCFTCIGKTLPIEQQVALLLKDVYQFSVLEISEIMAETGGVVKHLLHDARQTMSRIFANRCALVSKTGTCHQCTELNGIFNPAQNQQVELMKLTLVQASENGGGRSASHEELYELRAALVQGINPLNSSGTDLQDAIMRCTRKAIGEADRF